MPIRKKDDRLGAKKRFNPRTGEETNKPGGKDPRTIYAPKPQIPPERQMRTGGLSPKQKAIASKAPPPDKIDAKDFAVLKAEKAKGRGMGLQDESIKPGKVQKAFLGKMIKGVGKGMGRILGRKQSSTATPGAATMSGSGKGMGKMLPQLLQKAIDDGVIKPASKGRMMKADPTKPISSVAPKVTDALKKKKLPGRIGTALGIGSMLVPAAYAAAKQYKDYKSAKNRDKAKVKKYSKGGDLRLDYIDRQTRLNEKATGKKNYIAESKKTRREEYGAAKDRYPNKTDKLRSVAKNVGRALTPSFAAAKSVYDKLSKSSAEKYSVGGGADLGKKGIIKGINANLQDKAERRLNVPDRTDIKKQKTSVTKLKEQARRSRLETMKDRQTGRPVYERMGGGMMQRPMGYKKGVMVKARGCKLGRSKPTKMY